MPTANKITPTTRAIPQMWKLKYLFWWNHSNSWSINDGIKYIDDRIKYIDDRIKFIDDGKINKEQLGYYYTGISIRFNNERIS